MITHQENVKSLPRWEAWVITGFMLGMIIIIALA